MRSRSLAAQHDAAVAHRLELLTHELAAVRGSVGGAGSTRPRTAPSWSPQGHTHIRAVPDPEPGPEPEEPDDGGAFPEAPSPAIARLPGRHASRRVGGGWSGLVPETLRGRVMLGPGQLAVVAVGAVLGLVLTCWWLVRSAGHEMAVPTALTTPGQALTTPGAPSVAGASAGASTPPGAGVKVVVDVTGRVRHPGIVVLRRGARVIDAVRAAGGPRHGVDLGALNLARVLNDGEQIVVGASQGAAVGPSDPASGVPVTGPVDINTADATALDSLPEVGPVTAQAIITWRTEHGAFTSVDQLLDVDGIGEVTLSKLKPYVTV